MQQTETLFGQEFKVDWLVPRTNGIQLRTIWEIASDSTNPRLISTFIK